LLVIGKRMNIGFASFSSFCFAYNWQHWTCCSWLLVSIADILVTLSIIMDL
jgi:hypothetical protein